MTTRHPPLPTGNRPAPRQVREAEGVGTAALRGAVQVLFGGLWAWVCLGVPYDVEPDDLTSGWVMILASVPGWLAGVGGLGMVVTAVRERWRTPPGVLTVSEWPVVVGGRVRCRFERRLPRSFEVAGVWATLHQQELRRNRRSDWSLGHPAWMTMKALDWWRVTTIRVENGEVEARWELNLEAFKLPRVRDWGPAARYRWLLSVIVDGRHGERLTSHFVLDLAPGTEPAADGERGT